MTKPRKQIILAAYLGGVNHHTAWWHPPRRAARSTSRRSSTPPAPPSAASSTSSSWPRGSRCASAPGRSSTRTSSAAPTRFTVLASLAAVTEHLGLAGTLNATFNEPYELARQLATLDHLSGGRAAWNVVTSFDAFTGAELPPRRLPRPLAALRAGRRSSIARRPRSCGTRGPTTTSSPTRRPGGSSPARRRGVRVTRRAVRHHRPVHGAAQPAGPPGDPAGRASPRRAATSPPRARTRSSPRTASCAEAREFYRDIKARAVALGRDPDDLKILPAARFVLGDTAAEAQEKAPVRCASSRSPGRPRRSCSSRSGTATSPATTPTARCPTSTRTADAPPIIQGRAFMHQDRFATVAQLRAQIAEANGLSAARDW